jgi:hypothetical protein
MSTTRGELQSALSTPVQFRIRPITMGLIALLAVVALALGAIALATSRGGDESVYTKSVRVVPSAQHVPTPAERNQASGLNGPGMRP